MPHILPPVRPTAGKAAPTGRPSHAAAPAAATRPATTASQPFLALRAPAPVTLEAAAQRLGELSRRLEARGDRRAIFPAIYEMQVRAMARDLAVPGRYADPAWMSRMALDFAQRYFDAFDAYERGDRAAVPAAWLQAFDHARVARGPLVNELMLSMNAHINHDLPLSVAATGAEPRHAGDFKRFDAVLKANVDEVQALLETRFLRPGGSLAGGLDRVAGGLDEHLAGGLIANWRARAWRSAVAIEAGGEAAYGEVQRRSAWNARLLDAMGRLVPGALARRGLI